MADQSMELDLEFAYRLQLEEAMAASLTLHSSTSSPQPRVDKSEREKVSHSGEGSSRRNATDDVFRVYFKGLIREEMVNGSKVALAAVGVAICDSNHDLIHEIKNPLLWNRNTSRHGVEIKALIQGLTAALAMGLDRVRCYVDIHEIYQFLTRRSIPESHVTAALVRQVLNLRNKFSECHVTYVARNNIQLAFKLAKEAIISQITCAICLEETSVGQMFTVEKCLHRYCFSCMKQHVEVKLLHARLPKCPHEDCSSELNIDSCRNFLTSKFIDIMDQRLKEASIPTSEKFYCPYPRCSALMSKDLLREPGKYQIVDGLLGGRRCTKCLHIFCIHCKVPWHTNLSCAQYKKANPSREEDAKLKSLATKNLWRQCVECKHMIELREGCYHMTCRCGHQFCYTCGAKWMNKKATCKCSLWNEQNIIRQ